MGRAKVVCLVVAERMGVMAQKVAILSAVGRLDSRDLMKSTVIAISKRDARCAIAVVRRWIEFSKAFEARLNETAFERNVMKCVEVLQRRSGWVNRREIARRVRVPARELREIEQTLLQREQIATRETGKSGARSSTLWKWVG